MLSLNGRTNYRLKEITLWIRYNSTQYTHKKQKCIKIKKGDK